LLNVINVERKKFIIGKCRKLREMIIEMEVEEKKTYLVEYDNGCDNDDNDSYIFAIFESYEKAEEFCLTKGYEKTGTKGLFKKKWKGFWGLYYSLSIIETKMNEVFYEIE
jgi:hypothetical protein